MQLEADFVEHTLRGTISLRRLRDIAVFLGDLDNLEFFVFVTQTILRLGYAAFHDLDRVGETSPLLNGTHRILAIDKPRFRRMFVGGSLLGHDLDFEIAGAPLEDRDLAQQFAKIPARLIDLIAPEAHDAVKPARHLRYAPADGA
jgi:hypothetical protein